MTTRAFAHDVRQPPRAPALEKGLDILELLAGSTEPMTLSAIMSCLGRSHGELFRMVQVLLFREYLAQDPATNGYSLTGSLFSLGIKQPRIRNLVEAALPIMRQLSLEVEQSCHLALHAHGEMVVVARMESSEQVGLSVQVGARRPLPQVASGAVLYAFQPDHVRRRWEGLFTPALSNAELAAFRAHADEVRQRQVELTPSPFVTGVTDITAPVIRGGAAAAALGVPYLRKIRARMSPERTAQAVRSAAQLISDQAARTI